MARDRQPAASGKPAASPGPSGPSVPPPSPSSAGSTLREYVEAFGMAILLALFIRTFLVQAFKIPSGSMLPTLEIGDHLLVNKLSYGLRIPVIGKRVFQVFQPSYDDIVVFIYPEDQSKDYIKRVKAVAGETIEIRDKVIHVNGERVEDVNGFYAPSARILAGSVRDNFGPFTVPEGHVFVMGDNRDHSHDSRFWGTVPVDDILGRAVILYWSWDSDAFRPRFGRIGTLLR